jgi:hypothetical protein
MVGSGTIKIVAYKIRDQCATNALYTPTMAACARTLGSLHTGAPETCVCTRNTGGCKRGGFTSTSASQAARPMPCNPHIPHHRAVKSFSVRPTTRAARRCWRSPHLGATFQRRFLPPLFLVTTPASSAADADVGRRIVAMLCIRPIRAVDRIYWYIGCQHVCMLSGFASKAITSYTASVN